MRKKLFCCPAYDFFFQNFFVKKWKKIYKFGLNYHRCMVQPLVLRILKCSFWKYQQENFLPRKGYFPTYRGSIAPIHTKIMYDFTIVIINKYFYLKNDWLKISCFSYNFTQFCPMPLCYRNRKLRTISRLLERCAPKSNQLQIT